MSNSFWTEIDAQLDRIESEKPNTFEGVKAILDGDYPAIRKDANLNGVRTFETTSAFFAGSGGDRTLRSALRAVGWSIVWSEASYYYVAKHPATGDLLTYIEGDVYKGDAR